MTLEKKNSEATKEENKGLVVRAVSGLALLSLLFFRGRKSPAAPAKIKTPARAVARAENQTGRLEKA